MTKNEILRKTKKDCVRKRETEKLGIFLRIERKKEGKKIRWEEYRNRVGEREGGGEGRESLCF